GNVVNHKTDLFFSRNDGKKEDEAFTWLLKEVGIDDKITVKEYIEQYDVISKALPGAERLVRHLSKKGIPLAICSGSRSSTFRTRREPHKEWLDLIPLMVFCGDEPEIKRGKPHPDPYLATMNRFPVKPKDPSDVLVFEDAPNGGRAAKAAGMKCVMVPSESNRQEALQIG
ncbi:HAD hydrolase, family IA, variant 3, partial [Ostertagia ostertagi]